MKRILARVTIIELIVIGVVVAGCTTPQATAPTLAPPSISSPTPDATQQAIVRVLASPTAPASSTGASSAAPAATQPAIAAGQPKKGGTLRIIIKATPVQFGWTPTFAAGESAVANNAVEALTVFDKTGNPLPRLATSWSIAPDGKSITFEVRKGVKFQDGTDLNAAAVKTNIDLVLKERPGQLPGVKSVDVPGEYSVKVNLDYFSNNLWDRLGTGGLITSPAHLAKGQDAIKFWPLGTGPFKFVDWKRDAYVNFVRNENYWDSGHPYLDGVKILFIADAMAAQAALLAGEADVYINPDYKAAYDLAAKGFNVKGLPGMLMGLAPDTKNANSIFNDKRVREALEYAIDREQLAKTLGYGALEARYQFIAPGFLGYIEGLGRKYDPAKARQLLKEAGYPNGFKTSLVADPEFVPRDIVSAIQAYLKDVGIDLAVDYADPARYADWRRQTGWKDGLMFMRNGGFPWPPNLASFIFDEKRSDYVSLKRPDGMQQLLDKLMAAQTLETQSVFAKEFTQMVYDDATHINLYFQYTQVVEAPYVKDCGRMIATTTQWTPENCWLDK